jgi:signal transduction histidine kinase
MLERLEKSYDQAVRFSADAAHELNTPLTVLQGELEQGIVSSDDDSEDQRRYNALLEEVQHLKSITRKLLILSRADAGQLPLDLARLGFGRLIEAAVEDIDVLGPGITVNCEIASGVTIQADEELIVHTVQNLVHDACKYNQPEGWISVGLETRDEEVRMTISNGSERLRNLIPKKLFERFYRGDASRSRSDKAVGSGLGLSLSREIARAHGGDLDVQAIGEDQITFCLSLPIVGS